MALYLSAEQKNLKSLFANDDRFIIPSYQRPYSWTMEQCQQLFDDIMDAYNNQRDSYFLGNIVLAEDDNDDRPEVVDGQQRLITLWLFLKAFHIFISTNNKLKRMIQVESEDEGDDEQEFVSKIYSRVFEVVDQKQIERVLSTDNAQYDKDYADFLILGEEKFWKEHPLRVYYNAMGIYSMLKNYASNVDDGSFKSFVEFFIGKVYLLPIVLKDNDLDKARSNALMVFETINNRGMELNDADIFKARLYDMSLRVGKGQEFIDAWKVIIDRCKDYEITVDDLFRYYYHIIRGKQGIVGSEKGLRDFFQNDLNSPFKRGSYQHILSTLNDILDILRDCEDKKAEDSRLAVWLQLLYAYTNQYPVYALVCYLYTNKNHTDDELKDFLQKVVRYCYYRGSTTSVKFEIYNIIYNVSKELPVSEYLVKDASSDKWNAPGKMRKGMSLLAFYLKNPKQTVLHSYNVDKIVKSVDVQNLGDDWPMQDLDDCLGSLGNYVVLDIPKRNSPLYNRYLSYSQSSLKDVRDLVRPGGNFTYKDFKKRLNDIATILTSFFERGKINEESED